MPHIPTNLQKIMEAVAPPQFDWRYRPMFGGIGVYAGDRMCVSLSDVGLALKLAGAEHAALLKLKGAKALQYDPSVPPSKTYVVVPDAMLKDRKALGRWLAVSAGQAAAGQGKKSRKSGTKPSPAARPAAPRLTARYPCAR